MLVGLAIVIAFDAESLGGGGIPVALAPASALVRRFAIAVTSFDYRHVRSEIAAIEAMGTDGFRKDFVQAMGPNFMTNIVSNQTISTDQMIAGPSVQRVVGQVFQFFTLVNETVTSSSTSSTSGTPSSPMSIQVGLLVEVNETSNRVQSVQVF